MTLFRRKPHRKSILRRDSARIEGETVEEQSVALSTRLKKAPEKHRARASFVGRIVGVESNTWLVEDHYTYHQPHDVPFSPTHFCITGGVVTTDNREDESLLAVGDWVEFAHMPDDERRGVIVHVRQRQTRLFRRSPGEQEVQVIAANVERAFLVHSVALPYFSRRLLDRHLIAAEQGGVEPVIVFNKIDLGVPREIEQVIKYYRDQLGIPICRTSAIRGDGISELRALMRGVTSILIGASGVGKSALVNACFGISLQQVRAISRKYERGRHTTTNARLFHLQDGGELVDTPGMREFALAELEPEELAFYFHDFDEYSPECKYQPCTHTHEPNCAVRAAVERGVIPFERYESYLLILESL